MMVLCILAVILIVLAFCTLCTLCAIIVGSRYDKQNGLDSGGDTRDA